MNPNHTNSESKAEWVHANVPGVKKTNGFIYLFIFNCPEGQCDIYKRSYSIYSSIYPFQHSTLSILPLFVIMVSNRHTGVCVADKV
jgi:hypothetical protein